MDQQRPFFLLDYICPNFFDRLFNILPLQDVQILLKQSKSLFSIYSGCGL
ncbi:hypothetical protein Hanom_Chr05g00459971 [Helianthus anomalus]